MTTDDIKVNSYWACTIPKKFGTIVQVTNVDNAVNFKVVQKGDSDYRNIGYRERMGKQLFIDQHHSPVSDFDFMANSPAVTPVVESATVVALPSFDYDVEKVLDEVVGSIERWGGNPVRAYVLSQNCSKKIHLKADLDKFLDYAAGVGKLDVWEIEGKNHYKIPKMIRMVGLPGHDRSLGDGLKMPTDLSNRANALIESQYNKLTPEQITEIVELIKDGTPSLDIQRAYRVLSAIIGRIKREHGLENVKQRKSENTKKPGRKPKLESVVDFDDIVESLRNAPPVLKIDPYVEEIEAEKEAVARSDAQYEDDREAYEPNTVLVAAASEYQRRIPSGQQQFNVTVIKLLPREVRIPMTASDMGEAYRMASQMEGVMEVITVSKAR